VHGFAERTGDTLPVDLRLGTRLFWRVGRMLSLVDPLFGLPPRLDSSGLSRGSAPSVRTAPGSSSS